MSLRQLLSVFRGRSDRQTVSPAKVQAPATSSPAGEAVASKRPRKPARGPHDSIVKTIEDTLRAAGFVESNAAATLLEIGVGDATRAVAIANHFRAAGTPIRYVAIDQFEMGGGSMRLMDFHRTLRKADVRPHVYPETVSAGLTQIARTIGGVDVILVDQAAEINLTAVTSELARVSHDQTRMWIGSGGGWTPQPIVRCDLNRRDSGSRTAA